MLSDVVNNEKKRFFYLGNDKNNNWAGICFFSKMIRSTFIILTLRTGKYHISLTVNTEERYILIEKITNFIINKKAWKHLL